MFWSKYFFNCYFYKTRKSQPFKPGAKCSKPCRHDQTNLINFVWYIFGSEIRVSHLMSTRSDETDRDEKGKFSKSQRLRGNKHSYTVRISNKGFQGQCKISFKLLGVHFEGRLCFDYHLSQICRKASKKLHAFSRVCKYMHLTKRRRLMKAFISLQFPYCPLVWMFHNINIKTRVENMWM